MDTAYTLWGLFVSAFVSSTLLPGGSELVLVWLAEKTQTAPAVLLAVAAAGNTLGGMTSWGLGRVLVWRWPALEPAKPTHQRALARLRRWGSPVLLLSWLPVIGDPLCVAAGWLRIPWAWSALLIGVGKTARYAVILYAVGAFEAA